MDFGLSDTQRAYRAQVRDLVEDVSAELMLQFWAEQDAVGGDRIFPWSQSAHKMLCERGLVGVSLPDPWGNGAGPFDEYTITEELISGGFPSSSATYSSSLLRMIISDGGPDLIAEHLPAALRGERRYAGGLSEPEAGSDLFALKTSARRDGDHYVVNGSKLWTSFAHESQFISTIVRTDPGSTRHHGLSILLIPLDAPGVDIQPVWVIGGWRVNQCFFDDVRVPVTSRIGPENEGAAVLSARLADERGMSFGGVESRLLLARLIHRLSGETLDDRDAETLARFATRCEVERLLNIAAAARSARGEESSVAGSMGKVYGSELAQELAQWLNELLPESLFRKDWAAEGVDRLAADAEWFVRGTVTATIAGGTSEIQRNAIAQRGLGLPRSS